MDQIRIMANTPDQNRNYLRTYLQQDITQKIRLESAIALYEAEWDKLTESVVDEAETARAMRDLEKKRVVEGRLTRLESIKLNVYRNLQLLKERNLQMIEDGQAHMVALSEIEIDQGGFVALLFGLRANAEFDEQSQGLTLKPDGSAEAIIGTSLSSWKDSSQLKITLTKGGTK